MGQDPVPVGQTCLRRRQVELQVELREEAETGSDAFERRRFTSHVVPLVSKRTQTVDIRRGGGGVVIVFNRLTIVCREGINITGKCVSPFREK